MRILLVSTTAIGDTVMATPFLRAVRKKYPFAHISAMAHHRRISLLEHNPNFDKLLVYYGKGKKLFKTLWSLRRGKFNLAIVLHANDPDIVPLVRWSGAQQRVGWNESKWSRFFTNTIERTDVPEHFLAHKKRLLESIGIPVESLHTELFFSKDDQKHFNQKIMPWLQKFLPTNEYVVMHAFGSNPKKWWPLDHFFTVAQHIFKQRGWPTIFVGDDASLRIVDRHPRFDHRYHFAARGSALRESAYIIKQAKRMITTDSGPMHFAFAVKCPTLSLFGPTHPVKHGPCFDIEIHRVIHRDPLVTLTVEEVIQAWEGD